MGESARGYSWPPFAEGNTVRLRSGAWSARKVDPLTAELVAGLLADRPDLAAWPETVWAWARAEARCLLLAEYQVEAGLIDPKTGDVRSGRWVGTFERLAADLRGRLGIDPRSEAELARERADASRSAVDLAGIQARGREARLAAEARAIEQGSAVRLAALGTGADTQGQPARPEAEAGAERPEEGAGE